MISHETFAQRLWAAADTRKPIKALSDEAPDLTFDDGYRIQALGLRRELESGRRLAGYKMGLTSKAKQRDVNVHEAIRGYLLADMEVDKGGTVEMARRIHPRVEPEIAVILKHPLEGNVTLRDVMAALGAVVPALEILDSRFEAFSFKFADVIADNTSAAGFMLGREDYLKRLSDLSLLGVSIRKNGVVMETGAPAAVLGDPLLSVVELARKQRIEPGQVILTGGITAAVSFKTGDAIEVVWPGETLSFRAV